MSLSNSRRVTGSFAIDTVLARVRPGSDMQKAITAVYQHLKPKSTGSDLIIYSAEQLIRARGHQQRLFEVMLGSIGIVSLVLGGVGVMNVMLVSVQERRQEVGVRLAIGARPIDIRLLSLIEALILSGLGTILGSIAGIALCSVCAGLFGWDFFVWRFAMPLGAGVSLVIGVLSGLYPAVTASRLEPIEALRWD